MPSSLLTVRAATIEDVEVITDLINAAYMVEQFFVTGSRISQSDVLVLLELGTFLVAEQAGATVACVYLEPRGPSAYLGLLSVDPRRQRAGLGSRLLDAAEAHCAQRGFARIDIKVVSLRTELPPFYGRRGYVARGTEPFTDPRATRPCHFVVMSKPCSPPAGPERPGGR